MIDVVLMLLLLTLNGFHTLFCVSTFEFGKVNAAFGRYRLWRRGVADNATA